MMYSIVKGWKHSTNNTRALLAAADGCFYLLSKMPSEVLIVPANEDGTAIEWTDIVSSKTTEGALTTFLALTSEEIAKKLDCY